MIIHFSLLSTLFGPCHLNPNFIFCYFRLFWKHHLISININPVIPRVSTLSHKNIKVGSDGLFLSDMLPVVHYLPHPNCSLCFIPTYIRFLWLFVKYWNEYASKTHKDGHTPYPGRKHRHRWSISIRGKAYKTKWYYPYQMTGPVRAAVPILIIIIWGVWSAASAICWSVSKWRAEEPGIIITSEKLFVVSSPVSPQSCVSQTSYWLLIVIRDNCVSQMVLLLYLITTNSACHNDSVCGLRDQMICVLWRE